MGRSTHLLAVAGALAAAATLRCSVFTDLGGLSGGVPGDDAGATEAGGPQVLPGGDVDLVDDDAGDFDAGEHEGTAVVGGRVSLASARSGRFVSRVHDIGRDAALVSLAWTPGAPYGKRLPDRGGAERGYPSGALDMRDNVLLFHFDGPAGALSGAVQDESGSDNHGSAAGQGSTIAAGLLGGAMRDDIQGRVAVPVGAASGLNFGVSDFTWSYWVRSTQDCPPTNPPYGNRVHLGYDESSGDRTHLWLGCASTAGSSCAAPDGTGRAGGTWCSRQSPSSDCVGFCGRTPINDGKWHHVAVVKQGHNPGTLSLFVDGKVDTPVVPTAFATPIAVEPGIELAVGAFSGGTFPAAGDFDEVAVFRRALGGDEVRSLYLRGALSLSIRVRVCKLPDCSDDPPFAGPAAGAAFDDATPSLAPPAAADLSGLGRGRYVQYAAALASAAADASPELVDVRIRARP
jgi:hypothetical protein